MNYVIIEVDVVIGTDWLHDWYPNPKPQPVMSKYAEFYNQPCFTQKLLPASIESTA